MRIKTPGADAILAEIDAVTRDMDVMCFCGCGTLVTIASPSMYFASQACSELWHEFAHLPEEEASARRAAQRAGQAELVRRVRAQNRAEEGGREFEPCTHPLAEVEVIAGLGECVCCSARRSVELTQTFLAHAEIVRANAGDTFPEVAAVRLDESSAHMVEALTRARYPDAPPSVTSRLARLQQMTVQRINEWMNRD